MSDTPHETDSVKYDSETDTYRVDYDPRSESASVVLVSAISAITGREQTELERLQEVLDPESLDVLFGPTRQEGPRNEGRVEFGYDDFRVTVYSDSRIEIRPDGSTPDHRPD